MEKQAPSVKVYNNSKSSYKCALTFSQKLAQENAEVFSCQMTPDNGYAALACGDGFLRILDMKEHNLRHQIKQTSMVEGKFCHNPLTCTRWVPQKFNKQNSLQLEEEKNSSPLSDVLLLSTDGYQKAYSFNMSKNVYEHQEDPSNQLFALDINISGSVFATGGKDGCIRVYDMNSKNLIGQIRGSEHVSGHSNRIQCLKFHPKNVNLLFSSGWDNTIVVSDLRANCPIQNGLNQSVCGDSLDFHAVDEVLIAGGCEEKDPITFWDLRKSSHCLKKLDWLGGVKDHTGAWVEKHDEFDHVAKVLGGGSPFLYSLCLSPMQGVILAGGGSGQNELRMFDYYDGKLISSVHNLPMSVLSIDVEKPSPTVSDSSFHYIFGSSDSTLRGGYCRLRKKSMAKEDDN